MKNGPRPKAVALATGASLVASFGVAKAIEVIAPAPKPSTAGTARNPSAAACRIAGPMTGASPSTLLVIKRDDDRTYVVAQAPPSSSYVQAPAPAPAPAPVTRTS